jgi:hypothetical protein
MSIEYIGRDAIVQSEKICFTYQALDSTPRELSTNRAANDLKFNSQYQVLGDYVFYPYGYNNDLPNVIKEVIQKNYLAPGILKKKTQLLWGSGPKLYKETIENRQLIRDWQDDSEVMAWLESWDFETYLLNACTDYGIIEGVFTKFELTKGFLTGKPKVSKLEHISPNKVRLGNLQANVNNKPEYAIVNGYDYQIQNQAINYEVYKLFNFAKPFDNANAVHYSNMYSFCTDYYTIPDLYGSLEWLNRSTAIPLILKALSKNSINLKYHIVSPQAFWDDKEEKLTEQCAIRGVEYKSAMLEEYKEALLNKVAEVLSGEENTGKYWHTTKTFTVDGTNLIEHGWEIKVIDQNSKDYIESQISISQRADHAVSSGMGLHSALGNVSDTGKSDSGSEQLYALKNYMITGVDIPEMIVMKAINYAIKANFPTKNIRLGFYHIQPQAEQNISPSNRVKNIA